MRSDAAQPDRPAEPDSAPSSQDAASLDAMMAELAGDQIDRILAEQEARLIGELPQSPTVPAAGEDADAEDSCEPLLDDEATTEAAAAAPRPGPSPDDDLMAELADDDVEALLSAARGDRPATEDADEARADEEASPPAEPSADSESLDAALTDSDLQALLAAASRQANPPPEIASQASPLSDPPAAAAQADQADTITDEELQALFLQAAREAPPANEPAEPSAPAGRAPDEPQDASDAGAVTDEQLQALFAQAAPAPTQPAPSQDTPWIGGNDQARRRDEPPLSEEDLEAELAAQQADHPDPHADDGDYPPLDPAELQAMIAQARSATPDGNAPSAPADEAPVMTLEELDDLLAKQGAPPTEDEPEAAPQPPPPATPVPATPAPEPQPAPAAAANPAAPPWQAPRPAPQARPAAVPVGGVEDDEDEPSEQPEPLPSALRTLQMTLQVVNRPFDDLPPRLRSTAGLVGLILLLPALTLLILSFFL